MMMKTYNKPKIDYIIKIASKDLQSKLVIKYSGTENRKGPQVVVDQKGRDRGGIKKQENTRCMAAKITDPQILRANERACETTGI